MATVIAIVTSIIIGIPFYVWGAALSLFAKTKVLLWALPVVACVALLMWRGLKKRPGVPRNHLGSAPAGDEIIELRDQSS